MFKPIQPIKFMWIWGGIASRPLYSLCFVATQWQYILASFSYSINHLRYYVFWLIRGIAHLSPADHQSLDSKTQDHPYFQKYLVYMYVHPLTSSQWLSLKIWNYSPSNETWKIVLVWRLQIHNVSFSCTY